jgi:transposase-like protein
LVTFPPQIGPRCVNAFQTDSRRRPAWRRSVTVRKRSSANQGKKVIDVIKALGVTDVTYYRWRQEFGGMSVSQAKRLKELEKENERLRKAVSELTLDKMILREAAKGNF